MDDPRLEQLKQQITARGWQWRLGKSIPYGTQLIVSHGSAEATLDFYPKRGRTVIGGTQGPLRQALSELTASVETPTTSNVAAPKTTPQIGGAHIGMDESGKGDWFGPLVVAAVYLDDQQATQLRNAGVRDSKRIASTSLQRLVGVIERTVPPEMRSVYVLDPLEYNRRYAELQNVNLLLAELYAETAQKVQPFARSRNIVCDQFAQRSDRLELAFAAIGLPKPTQLHHAEDASTAVAAASVLATARFADELQRLGKQAGLSEGLPRGASAIAELQAAARTIIAREGKAGLGNYAKLNFTPIQALLAEL